MSSVGSSDSSSGARNEQSEVIRKNREEHQNNEAEMVKRHRTEVRRINEDHYKEVENLKRDHELQMKEMRKQTNSEVDARDFKHQKDIDDLRGLYKKQLQTQADENQRAHDTLRSANKNDRSVEQKHAKERFEKLNKDYEKGLSDREATYEESLTHNREEQTRAIRNNADRLGREYDERSKSLKDERNMRVSGLQRTYDEYRQNSEARFRDQDLRHFQDQQRASDNMLRAVAKERLSKQDSEAYLRDGFKDGLEKQRDRFESAMAAEREMGHISREELRTSVGSRIEDQIRRLEQEKMDLKDANVRNELKMKQDKEHQVAAIADSFQRNLDNYRDQRDMAVAQANDLTHRDINRVRKEYDELQTMQARHYRGLEEERNQIHKKAYDTLNRDFHLRQEQTKMVADKRVKDLYETTAEDKTRLSEMQIDNHKASQRVHQDEMKQLRMVLEEDKQNVVANLTEHMQRQEIQHSERMTQIVSKYEKQVQQLKDELVKEKKNGDENLRRATDEMQRQHKLAMDQVAQQNRDKLRQADNQHAEELRTLNKRNDQKVDDIMTQIKKT